MCVLSIHVVDFGQVAYTAGYGYVTFVFNCPGSTEYTGISILSIGMKGTKRQGISGEEVFRKQVCLNPILKNYDMPNRKKLKALIFGEIIIAGTCQPLKK